MTIAIRVLAALLLLGGASLARSEARVARAEAEAWQQLATLRYDDAATVGIPDVGLLTSRGTGSVNPAQLRTTVEYWLGRYDELVERDGGAADPEVLFVAANAAYRAARREPSVGPDAARQLDPVLRAYAAVLKAAGRHADASYNLEYVARLRNRLAGMKPPPAAKEREPLRAAGPIETTDLPRGPTVHGLPGGPPPAVKVEEFEVLTPRGFDEREADPEEAPGGRVRRKG